METFTVKQFVTLSIFIVNLHKKYIPKAAQSKELSSAVQRVIIHSLNMLKDLTQTTPETSVLEGHILKCIEAINDNKGITEADTNMLELSTSQLIEVYDCFQYAQSKDKLFLHHNSPEYLNLVRFFVSFTESINEKLFEEIQAEMNL